MTSLQPFGLLDLLLVLVPVFLAWWWLGTRFTERPANEDPDSIDPILRDILQGRRRQSAQPPQPADPRLGLGYRIGRLLRDLWRVASTPAFRAVCCMLGGALLGHLIHAVFLGGTLGALPRQLDPVAGSCLLVGAIAGLAWGRWSASEIAEPRCRSLHGGR